MIQYDKSCEQIVLFSNDSDISPALKITKERNSEIKIGIITPIQTSKKVSSLVGSSIRVLYYFQVVANF